MGKTGKSTESRTIDLGGLLAGLAPQKLEVKDVSEQLKEIALETKLLSLADVAIERETEVLREIVDALKPAGKGRG